MSSRFSALMLRIVVGFAVVAVLGTGIAKAQYGHGSIRGWGSQVVGVDLSGGFLAVAGGGAHSLGLKADGSIVAWGSNGTANATCRHRTRTSSRSRRAGSTVSV